MLFYRSVGCASAEELRSCIKLALQPWVDVGMEAIGHEAAEPFQQPKCPELPPDLMEKITSSGGGHVASPPTVPSATGFMMEALCEAIHSLSFSGNKTLTLPGRS